MTGAVVGGVVAATRPPPPMYYHGGRYRQVVVVRDQPRGVPPCGPNERLIMVSCPNNCRPGMRLEIEVENRPYAITIPQGVRPGQAFYVRVPKPQPTVYQATPSASSAQQQQQQQPVYQATAVSGNSGGGGGGTVYQATAVQSKSTKAESEYSATVLPEASVVQASAAGTGSEGVLEAAVVATAPNDPPAIPGSTSTSSVSSANPFIDDPPAAPDPNAWAVTPAMKADYDAAFVAAGGQLVPGGRLQPNQVKDALLQSNLPRETLRSIWELSDIDKDGTLDLDEWAVAKHLTSIALQGQPMPAALPPNMVPPAKRNPF